MEYSSFNKRTGFSKAIRSNCIAGTETDDLDKLAAFRDHPRTKYKFGIEVIIGTKKEFIKYNSAIPKRTKATKHHILWIVKFDLDTQETEVFRTKHILSPDAQEKFGLT